MIQPSIVWEIAHLILPTDIDWIDINGVLQILNTYHGAEQREAANDVF